ncbi:DNA/RNA non-specific endonuclease, partial [Pseudoalteromonas denitrificans]
GTIISMIPVIDQVMDCRDVCANTMMLTDDEQANDSDGWIALTLTGIGFIPLFGSAVKGVGKVIVKNPKESISLAAATLRKIGKGDPIAYIKNIDWKALGKQGAELIKEKISAIQAALTAITNSNAVKWFVDKDLLDNLRKQSKQLSELLPKVDAGIKNAIAVIENKVKRALKSYEGELPHTGKTGDVKKVKTDELTAPKGNDLKGAPPRVINLKQGEKGGWNKALNGKLEPHATYKVGKYTYKTDELGRVKSVGGELDLSKVDRNTYQQGKAGKTDGIKDGLSDDEGGHLIASIFKGPGEQINYAAMDGNLNKGAWKRMENKWAKALKGDPPKKVEVEINAIYDGDNKRPSAFEVFYEIDGIEEMKKLKNAPGG